MKEGVLHSLGNLSTLGTELSLDQSERTKSEDHLIPFLHLVYL